MGEKELKAAANEMALMWEEEKLTRDFDIAEVIREMRKLELEIQYMYAEDLKSRAIEDELEALEIEEEEKERAKYLSTISVSDHPMVATNIQEYDPIAKRISAYTEIELDKVAVVATPVPSIKAKKAWELIKQSKEYQIELNKMVL